MEENVSGENLLDNRNRKELDLSSLDETIQEEASLENENETTNYEDNNTLFEEPQIDYKEKFTESTREASALYFKNQKLNQTIEEAASIAEPTLEELKFYAKSKGAEYDDLDEFSQNILKDTLINTRRFEKIQNVASESKRIDEWANSVDSFIEKSVDSGEYPSLNSLGSEFKKFAMKESRRGVDLNDLVASFLFSAERSIKQTPRKSVLLTGGNSSAVPSKSGLSETQVAMIRETNPKEYRRMIKSGEINLEI